VGGEGGQEENRLSGNEEDRDNVSMTIMGWRL
jgi:hypothetical protein